MEVTSKKRTLDSFFAPSSKKARTADHGQDVSLAGGAVDVTGKPTTTNEFSEHPIYPFPIPHLPIPISSSLRSLPSTIGKIINDQPDLDLLYFQPYIPKYVERQLFEFIRSQLPFYRVEYNIKRGNIETQIKTPRYTTVFGLDETSRFDVDGQVITTAARAPVEISKDRFYAKYPPRPIPRCLDDLRQSTEAATGCKFNFCLVNYYASGQDSISYHSDDERFLGPHPAIASFSLGAKRDFLLKHKPIPQDGSDSAKSLPGTRTITLALGSGDMVLMRGTTQANWLHSIPKRSGKNKDDGGRINITFRKALVKAGTENYYNYNVGMGPVYKWDEGLGEMRLWERKG